MFGLPRQTLADWERAMDAAFALRVPHLSMYGLIVEERTPFWARRERGKLPLPTEDAEATMFARAIERATDAGYVHYEVSNYALPGCECRHNQVYWRNEAYFGFGAGAVGYRGGVRATNVRLPSRYIEAVSVTGTAFEDEERLDALATMGETMMVGLRLRRGVDLEWFAARFGVRAEAVFANEIARYTDMKLLETRDDFLRLTDRGLFFASDVMADFLQ